MSSSIRSLIIADAFSAISRASSRVKVSFECGCQTWIVFSRNSFEYVIFFPLPVPGYPSLFAAKLFLKRSKDKAVDRLPDIGNEPDRLKIPVLVIVAEVIGMDFFVEEKDALREQVFPEPFNVNGKRALADPKDYEPDMA